MRNRPATTSPGDNLDVPRLLGFVTVAVATLVVIWQLRFNLVFANTTPTGVDLGGHVWGPAQWSAHVYPHLSAWSPEWFAGLPTYVFYMPFPAVLVGAFDVLLPYGVALKLVVALGPLALPWTARFVAQRSEMSRLAAVCMPIMTLGFLFDDSWWRYGGNLRSAIAGEFSYAIALIACLLALACFDRVLRCGRGRVSAATFTAIALLSHPVISIVLGVGVAILTAMHAVLFARSAARRIIAPVAVAVVLAATWWIPFVWYSGELNNIGNPRDTSWAQLFFPLPGWAEIAILCLAGFGVAAGIRRRHPMILTLSALTLLGALAVLALPSGILENGRLLPIWHLGRWLLAGVGIAEILDQFAATDRRLRIAIPSAVTAFVVLCVGITTGSLPGTTTSYVRTPSGLVSKSSWIGLPSVVTNIVPLWIKDGFGGYERQRLWWEYKGLIQTLNNIGTDNGCGRALTEDDPSGAYGSRYEFALFPYWTRGCIQSMQGIPEEMSRTQPFVRLASAAVTAQPMRLPKSLPTQTFDLPRGVRMMHDLGIRYYMAYSKIAVAAADQLGTLRKVATSGSWHIYEVRDTTLVVPLDRTPVRDRAADDDRQSWANTAIPAFIDGTQPTIVGNGPAAWTPNSTAQPKVVVSQLRIGRNTISFHVDRVGVPILIRSTWFPWWRVSGAVGPWRAVPNYMVVVPTSANVTLNAQPRAVDLFATWIGFGGVLGLIALAVFSGWTRRSRQVSANDIDGITG